MASHELESGVRTELAPTGPALKVAKIKKRVAMPETISQTSEKRIV